ncbi:MAG: DNA helicase II, partial [Pseudomonadota bacterium]
PQSDIAERAAEANVYNSPGWKRLQARSGEHGISQPREAKGLVIDMNAVSSFSEGDRVFHQKFGYGIVCGIEGDKLDIEFDKAGSKKVVAGFVTAADDPTDVPF